MSEPTIKVTGDKAVLNKLKKLSNPLKTFDSVVKNVALQGMTDLKITTNKDTGTTSRAWLPPKKLSDSKYDVSNNIKTGDGDKFIVNILNDGRKRVVPIKSNKLYIPLSEKGKSKKRGAPIPKSFVFGIDYVLAKSSKAVKGTKFIAKSIKKFGKIMTASIIKEIRRIT